MGAAGVGGLSVLNNVMLPVLDRMRNWFGLDVGSHDASHERTRRRLPSQAEFPSMPLSSLSGGNQQKALMGKWLQTKPRLILLEEPTQGVDVGARQQLLTSLNTAAKAGAAVLLASTDYDQLAQICHRVIIFVRGQATAELPALVSTRRRSPSIATIP